MDWCKLWAEWATDPKVQIMSECMRCRHVMLLCLRATQDTAGLTDEEVATYMRVTPEQIAETKDLFIKKGFIDESWGVIKWNKRQASVSDAANRMRRMSERKRNALRNSDDDVRVTVAQPFCNGDVTPRNSVTPPSLSPPTPPLISSPVREETPKDPPTPRKRGKPSATADDCSLPSWLPRQDLEAWLQHRKSDGHPVKPESLPAVIRKLARFREAGHDPLEILEAAIVGGYQGLFAPTDSRPTGKPASKSKREERPWTEADAEAKRRAHDEYARQARLGTPIKTPLPAVAPMRDARPPAKQLTPNELRAQIERMKREDGTK